MIYKHELKILMLGSALTFSVLGASGCIPVAVVGGGGAVVTSAAEERGVGGVLSDASIKTRVQMKLGGHSSQLFNCVDINVRQGRVLLTGIVDTPEMQIDAVRLTWQVDGVQEVIDELRVGQQEGFGMYAKDSWISTQLKSSLLFDEKVQSINYNIHTIARVVYLMGVAQSQEELNHVIHKARTISGVKHVVSYVQVKFQSVGPTRPIKTTPEGNDVHQNKPQPLSAQQKSQNSAIEVQDLDAEPKADTKAEPNVDLSDDFEDDFQDSESIESPNTVSAFN